MFVNSMIPHSLTFVNEQSRPFIRLFKKIVHGAVEGLSQKRKERYIRIAFPSLPFAYCLRCHPQNRAEFLLRKSCFLSKSLYKIRYRYRPARFHFITHPSFVITGFHYCFSATRLYQLFIRIFESCALLAYFRGALPPYCLERTEKVW